MQDEIAYYKYSNKNNVEINETIYFKKKKSMASLIAMFFFFILYPFRHLYTYNAAIGKIPELMDGFFGFILIIALFTLGCFFIDDLRKMKLPAALITLLFMIFIITSAGWVLTYKFLGTEVMASFALFDYYMKVLLNYCAVFLIGFYMRFKHIGKMIVFAFILIFINTIVNIDPNRLMIDLRQIVDPSYGNIYLSLSATALFTGLISWSILKSNLLKSICLLATAIILFIFGSRADFGIFLLIMPIALWFSLRLVWHLIFYAVTFISLVGFISVAGINNIFVSRHFEIFTPEQFYSFIARKEQFSFGFERIMASPIIGDYGGVLAELGSIGSYIHNLLSVWQAFGLLTFIAYVSLLILVSHFALTLIINNISKADQRTQLVLLISIVVLAQVFLARAVNWHHVALAWGMIAGWWQDIGSKES